MKNLTIYPGRLRHFGPSQGSSFCLVTNAEFVPHITIEHDADYQSYLMVPYDGKEAFSHLLAEQIPEYCHILTILPNALLEAPTDAELGPHRKLSIMACNSAPTPWEAVEHFLRAAEKTDPEALEAIAERFFEQGEASERLVLVDPEYNTRLVFDHLSEDYNWFEQLGFLGWGGQQVFPAGEISVFLVPLYPTELDQDFAFNFEGTLALRGYPILHSGPPSFQLEDQARIHGELATMENAAVIATVEHGVITDIQASAPPAEPARRMLQTLFEVDSRYRKIFEVGFALNSEVELYPGNIAMNEVYGGEHGSVHFGLGMLPHTQYHLDLICPGTRLLGHNEAVILGQPLPSA